MRIRDLKNREHPNLLNLQGSETPAHAGTRPHPKPKSNPRAPRTVRQKRPARLSRGLKKQIVWRLIHSLKPFRKNPRGHPEAQIAALMKSIERFWTIPILIDETGTILAGHLRWEVAKRLGMAKVPTIMIVGLSESEKSAVVIADNRLPEQAIWDFDLLREHFKELIELDFDVEFTGFSTGEVDLIIDGNVAQEAGNPADDLNGFALNGPAISKSGDIWEVGRHRVICGNALERRFYERLLHGDVAQMVVTDPPYNVPIAGHAMGRGKVRHRNFEQAAGEMSPAEFIQFLERFIRLAITFSRDGSIHYIFMDWRHLPELLKAAKALYAEWKNLLVWNKDNAGQGSFYRAKHELIAVLKNGTAPHINNFGLGAKGRYRTNVLDYPSVNSLHPARKGDLALHPTVKPVALIADLIRDCSKRKGVILDPFGGSGTTILAAERTGRIARLIELDPLYVDVAVRRWERITGVPARHATSGLSFEQVAAERGVSTEPEDSCE